MAVTQKINTPSLVREEDLEDMRGLMRSLQESIDTASRDGRVVMMGVYVELLALVSAKVHKIEARFKREMLASFRKEHKDKKAQERAVRGEPHERSA